MPPIDPKPHPAEAKRRWFTTTHWTVVLAAGRDSSPEAAAALEELCRTYWYPLYAFLRRDGQGPDDAQDLTQEFFRRFLEKNYLKDVDRQKGKFRSFLLASVKHFLANEWDRKQAVRRGSEYFFVSWDAENLEQRYGQEPSHDLTAEKIYERRWALTVLERALGRLKEECVAAGKAELFDTLEVYLSGGKTQESYVEVGARLNLSEGAVKVAVHRLRRRYGELLRAEIAHTVASPAEVEEEMRHLFRALSS